MLEIASLKLEKVLKKSFKFLKQAQPLINSDKDIQCSKINLIYEVSQSDKGSFSLDKLKDQNDLKSEFFEKINNEFMKDKNIYLPWTKNEIINAIYEIVDILKLYKQK